MDNYTLSVAQTAVFTTLANLCPYINAEAVSGARAMLDWHRGYVTYYYDQSICFEAGIAYKMGKESTPSETDKSANYSLFSNPMDDFFEIISIDSINYTAIEVIDVLGRKINLPSSKPYEYTIHITSKSGNQSIQKIIKQ
jgi:hypothetical protein